MKRYKIFKLKWEIIPIVIFLGIWETIARLDLMPGQFFFPPFSAVLTEFWYLTTSGVLGRNFLSSLIRVLIGFSAGSIAGLFIGIIMGWNNVANKALNPIISLVYPIPALGWLPLLMLWFGIGEILPIAIIFICSFFPILYNTVTGIKNVGKNYIFVARTLGASDLKILSTVVVPLAAIPTGIGALMMKAESLIRIDIIIVCLIVLGVMCLSFEKFFAFLEKKLTNRWR